MIDWFDDPAETPLTHEELEELKIDVSTRDELNAFEAANISSAMRWAATSRLLKTELLRPRGLTHLHRRMFQDVWRWAGKYRGSNKNIGVAKECVPEEIRKLCDDVVYWETNETYTIDEIATRLHHRLVWIHPFVNGNGRHARLVTDLYLESRGSKRFRWGAEAEQTIEEIRKAYVSALREADQGNFVPLLAFLRPQKSS